MSYCVKKSFFLFPCINEDMVMKEELGFLFFLDKINI